MLEQLSISNQFKRFIFEQFCFLRIQKIIVRVYVKPDSMHALNALT